LRKNNDDVWVWIILVAVGYLHAFIHKLGEGRHFGVHVIAHFDLILEV